MLIMQFVQVNCTLHRGPSSFPNDSEERSRSKYYFFLVCVRCGEGGGGGGGEWLE